MIATLRRIIVGRVTWVRTALLLAALFGVFHLLGWRDDTSIISGTVPADGGRAAIIRGVLYALSYFAAVVVAPILLLATAIDAALRRGFQRRE